MTKPRPLPANLADRPFSTREFIADGAWPGRLRARDLTAPHRGVRWSVDDPSVLGRARALVPVLDDEATFSHLTAARIRGLPVPWERADEPVHVIVRPPRRGPRRPGVVTHRVSDERVTAHVHDGVRVTDDASTFCHLAASLSLGHLVAVGDAMARDVDPLVLAERAAAYRRPGARRARQAAALVRVGAESPLETRLRVAIVGAGMPEPELNVTLVDGGGRFLARVDMLFRAYGVVVEYDGRQHAESAEQFRRDLARLDDLAAAGYRVVRIGSEVLRRPSDSLDRVRRALIAAGWRP